MWAAAVLRADHLRPQFGRYQQEQQQGMRVLDDDGVYRYRPVQHADAEEKEEEEMLEQEAKEVWEEAQKHADEARLEVKRLQRNYELLKSAAQASSEAQRARRDQQRAEKEAEAWKSRFLDATKHRLPTQAAGRGSLPGILRGDSATDRSKPWVDLGTGAITADGSEAEWTPSATLRVLRAEEQDSGNSQCRHP